MTVPMLILSAVLATGQAPTPPHPSTNLPDDRLAAVPAPRPATVEGCVATVREVHGRSTNLAERIGLDDGFVLTAIRMIKGRAPASAAGTPARMFAIDGLSDEQLKPHLGRRVRIEGSLLGGAPDAGRPGTVAALTATTVRQVSGDCPVPKIED